MRLSQEQAAHYDRYGYLFFHRLFGPDEVAQLRDAVPGVIATGGAGLMRESTAGAVRLVHGPHLTHELIGRLSRHPRLLAPARQLLGTDVYTFQSRLVMKDGIGRHSHPGYPWHQDFSTWYDTDGMPEPRALVFAVFIDEVTACNAPVLLVPRSHRHGILRHYDEPEITPTKLAELVEENGIVAQLGAPGSVLLIHPNLVHASGPNISPLRRAFYYIIYNSVTNLCVKNVRKPHHSNPDVTPLVALEDDCLLEAAGAAQ